MAFCLTELHLWSSRKSLQVKDTDVGTYQYYEKGEPVEPSEHHYYKEKQQFTEMRGYAWTPKNRKKLRDSLRELEEILQTTTCVHTRWKNKYCCQLVLSSGVLVTLTLNGPQLERVCVDRTLVGRLPAQTLTDAVLTDRLLLMTFLEKSEVCAVFLNRKNQGGSPETEPKLTPNEMKVVCVEVCVAPGRRLSRRVALNQLQDVAVCWGPLGPGEELWPWTPGLSHSLRQNMVLLSCSPTDGLKVLSSVRTEGDPLDCCFSLLQPYQLLSVQLPEGSHPHPDSGPQGGVTLADACVYEVARGRLQLLSVTRLPPLSSRPLSIARHPSESVILLGLSDSSLLLYDQRSGGPCLRVPCPLPPSLLAWHPAGAMVVVGGGQGELACFDVGLAPLGVALLGEERTPGSTLRLAQHLRSPGGLGALSWGAGPEGAELLLLALHGGPLAALRFKLGALTGGALGQSELLQQRLRCGQVDQALGILGAMEWSTMGAECFQGLSSVTNHLLRLELDAEREAQLEAALGVFYAPARPLSDTLVLEYREPISKYARRFFHHLLRHQRLEKAFLLAVDIGSRDLFMDLHYVAVDTGEAVLADVAKRKADEIDALSITAGREPLAHVGWRNGGCDGSNPRQTDGSLGTVGPSSQDNVASRDTQTWPWRHTNMSLVDEDKDEENADSGTLKLVHFGLV